MGFNAKQVYPAVMNEYERGQIQMVILDRASMIPENHLLRQIKDRVNFEMLLIGYPYGIKSERRLEEVETINRSTIKYMEELEAELSSMPGYKKPENVETEKESLKSRTDPECGYIHQARKKGMGYLAEITEERMQK